MSATHPARFLLCASCPNLAAKGKEKRSFAPHYRSPLRQTHKELASCRPRANGRIGNSSLDSGQ